MADKKRPRRNWKSTIIDPFKQLRIGLYAMGISMVFVCVMAGLFVLAFYQQYENVMEMFGVIDPSKRWDLVIDDVFTVNAWRIGLTFVAYLAVLFWVMFKMTHKVYGPLVSIERFVEQIEKGDYSRRARIREKDDLQRLVGKLNEMAKALEDRHGSKKK